MPGEPLHKEPLVPGAALSACTQRWDSLAVEQAGGQLYFQGISGGKKCAESVVLRWESQALARPEMPGEPA